MNASEHRSEPFTTSEPVTNQGPNRAERRAAKRAAKRAARAARAIEAPGATAT